MFGRDHRALDNQDVQTGLDRHFVVLTYLLGGQRPTGDGALGLDLSDPGRDQLRLHRLGIDLLHHPGRLVLRRPRDTGQLVAGVLEPGPDPLEVENAEPTESVDQDSGLGTDHAVHRRSDQRQIEAVGTEGPGDVDVVRVPGPPGGHDRHVVEAVGPPTLLTSTDLYFQCNSSGRLVKA